METLDILKQACGKAQSEMALAELQLAEATAKADALRTEAARLEAAVAALTGEPPPAAYSAPIEVATPETTPTPPNTTPTPGREDTAEMTKEEFDAHRRQRQAQKRKEEQANNPYAHIKCSGCGSQGTMGETIMQAPSGAPVRMMVCGSCGNQLIS